MFQNETEVILTSLSHGWHSFTAMATDPMNATDLIGALQKFYVDILPEGTPISQWKDRDKYENKGIMSTSKMQISVAIQCTDDNPIEECTGVEWRVQSGSNVTDWVLSTTRINIASSSSSYFSVLIDYSGIDGEKLIALRSIRFKRFAHNV